LLNRERVNLPFAREVDPVELVRPALGAERAGRPRAPLAVPAPRRGQATGGEPRVELVELRVLCRFQRERGGRPKIAHVVSRWRLSWRSRARTLAVSNVSRRSPAASKDPRPGLGPGSVAAI